MSYDVREEPPVSPATILVELSLDSEEPCSEAWAAAPAAPAAREDRRAGATAAKARPLQQLMGRLQARKTYLQLQHELAAQQEMKRTLGALDLVFIGIGAIIGTGIFVLAGVAAAKNAGPSVILSFIISGFAASLAGLCYAELATMIPMAGSAYTFTYATMGEFVAWVIGWDLLLEYVVGAAAVSVGWSAYFVSFFRDALGLEFDMHYCGSPITWSNNEFQLTENYFNVPAAAICLATTALLVVGVRESAWLNHIIVAIKLLAVVLVICAGLSNVQVDNFSPFFPPNEGSWGRFGVSGMMQASSTVFFSYIGFDAVTTMAQETKDPQQSLPIGILGSLSICTLLYVLMSIAMVGAVPYTSYEGVAHPVTLLAQLLGLQWLAILASFAALCGLSSVLLVCLMGQPRIFYSMAKDGLLPPAAAAIHPRFQTPYVTTIISGLCCAAAGGALPIDILADMSSIGTLFAFILCSIGLVVLRYTQPDAPRQFRVPSLTLPGTSHELHIVPLLSVLCCSALVASTTWETICRFLIWLAIGLLVYFAYGIRHSGLRVAAVYNSSSVGGVPAADLPGKL